MAAAAGPQPMTWDEPHTRPKRSDGSNLTAADISELKSSITGKVVVKGEVSDEEYLESSVRWNRFFAKEPYIVTFPQTEAEVGQVLRFVSKHNLDLAVSGGRHSYHGASSVEGGIVIDMRNFRNVKVDREARTVSAGGGCLAEDVERPAAEEGLHVVFGAVNDTGIGGLSLGGGIGMLSGQYGLAVDNIVAVRMVLANGEAVTANDKENADLFWAVRGGGSNFGIVTEFTFKGHPHRTEGGLVYFSLIFFTPPQLSQLIHVTNELYDTAIVPSKGRLGIQLAVSRPPQSPVHVPGVMAFYDGPEEEAKELLKPIFDLSPVGIMGGMQPYCNSTNLGKMMPDGEFNRHYGSGVMMDFPLDETALKSWLEYFLDMCQRGGEAYGRCLAVIEARLGPVAVNKDPTVMAYANRFERAGVIGMNLRWADPALDETMVAEAKKMGSMLKEAIQKKRDEDISTTGAIVDGEVVNGGIKGGQQQNLRALDSIHPTINGGDIKLTTMFGPNLPKLKELKKKFDPESVFDKWYYINPA